MIKGNAAEDVDAHMNDLDRLSSIHCFSSFRSASDIEYMQPNGGLPPSSNLSILGVLVWLQVLACLWP